MSASQQKKKRQNAAAQPVTNPAEKRAGRGAWIAAWVLVAVVAVLAVFFALYNTGFFQNHTTAAVAGAHRVSPTEYNYFYQNAYSSTYAGYLTDPDTPLSQQIQDETTGRTWADYLREETDNAIASVYSVYDAAVAGGFTLSDEDRADIENQMLSMEQAAASQNVSLKTYLSSGYGAGATPENFRSYLEVLYTASAYQTAYADGLSYTDSQVEDYYQENRETLSSVTYRSFPGLATEEEANAFIGECQGSETAFADLARANASEEDAETYENDDATLSYATSCANLPAYLHDWLTDAARQPGDGTALAADDGTWTAVLFLSGTAQTDPNTVTVRHILMNADSETTAQQVLDQFLAGPQTEEDFADLARTYSADGNAAEGGIYEDLYPGQMVRSFNDWCFDDARQPGDTGIVETSYGTHVMYFVGRSDRAAHAYRAEQALRTADADAWAEGLRAAMPVTEKGFGMWFTAIR